MGLERGVVLDIRTVTIIACVWCHLNRALADLSGNFSDLFMAPSAQVLELPKFPVRPKMPELIQ